MIITMNTPQIIKPRRGKINATPSGLGYRSLTHFYYHHTPSGLGKCNQLFFYNNITPSGLKS